MDKVRIGSMELWNDGGLDLIFPTKQFPVVK